MDTRPSRPETETAVLHTSADGGPLYFAALAEVHHSFEPDERDGFVIITAAADHGLIDIHDRKPLVLTPELAREWLAPATSPERAAAIVKDECRPSQDFRWFPISKAVGNFRNQGPALIKPVSEGSRQGDLGL